jgi:hypothetical protein
MAERAEIANGVALSCWTWPARRGKGRDPRRRYDMVQNRRDETIVGETVIFSAETTYTNCTFVDCAYEFDGTGLNATDCTFGIGDWQFTGAAITTVDVIRSFWTSPGSEPLLELIFARMTGSQETARQIVALKPAI